MDGPSFDRMARLFGGTTTRRGSILTAAAVALGLKAASEEEEIVLAADAADEDVEEERRRKRCKPSAKGKKGGKKSRCRRNTECCSLLCKGKRRKKKKKHKKKDAEISGLLAGAELDEFGFDEDGYEEYIGDDDEELQGFTSAGEVETEKRRRRRRRCRCRKQGATCNRAENCCAGTCTNGRCSSGGVIPTGLRCAPGDVCKSGAAICSPYASGNPSGTYCVLADGRKCQADGDCYGQSCKSGICTGGGAMPIPTGQRCRSGDVCETSAATCTQYTSGNPTGTYCLLPDGKKCTADGQCEGQTCKQGICEGGKPKIPTGQACIAGSDVCKDDEATCTAYLRGGSPGTYCLLSTGAVCTSNSVCDVDACVDGACSCPLAADFESCTTNADCCSGLCSLLAGGDGRCIRANTFWSHTTWGETTVDAGTDVDTWVQISQNVPFQGADSLSSFFANGGNVVNWWTMGSIVPSPTYSGGKPGNEDYPNGDDTYAPLQYWLDVDNGSGDGGTGERFMALRPQPGSSLRVMIKNYGTCFGDQNSSGQWSSDACGPNWEGLDLNYDNLFEAQATVDLYIGLTKVNTVVATPQPGQPNRAYWWIIADVTFDASGNPTISTANAASQLCMPITYAISGASTSNPYGPTIPDNGGPEVSNFCAL